MLPFELAIRGQSTDDSHMSMTLSAAEAKDLLQLCKAGRLLDVQDWISSGKLLCVPSDFRTTPLKVALDTGFHSLVELLVRNEASQEIKNRALRKAVALKRLDFVELLVLNGAEIASVPFIDVLYAWDPNVIRYFLDHRADFLTGYPFAFAFGEKIRTALGPWKECKQKYPHLAGALADSEKAIELKPSLPAFMGRGYFRYQKRDFDTALADFNKAIALKPDYANAYVDRGLVQGLKGEISGAIAILRKAQYSVRNLLLTTIAVTSAHLS
jgi:tetratricopeptide (TPR) repeat protein